MNRDSNIENDILAETLDLPPDQRAGFLKGACRGDEPLRQRLEDLLRVRGDAGGIGETEDRLPTMRNSASIHESPGAVIGRYKLLQKIGEGGCGVVYMAGQSEPVRRRVALKVIKLGMDTKAVIARFEAERQALALMDHPNIAKVLDGGATDAGRPYFVMELVRGTKITEYCDENNLSTRDRLGLFIEVCQAIQHAHQKGVIHRDIKPSNILVTDNDGVAVPKVIDFGIAKATTGLQLTDKTLFTSFEQFIGTPAYMSPEQAVLTSIDIDTRSDIYSLGVLLYEMLAGQTPFDPKELLASGLDEMRRTIREQEPLRPSTRLSAMRESERTTMARRRQSDAPRLINLLRGDLDWIVMKCLEKNRARRYETASGLAADLQRHLANEPVTARPPGAAYKLQKAWQRNKLAWTAAAAVLVALVIGIGASLWQTRRAWQAERGQTRLSGVAYHALLSEREERARAEVERQRAQEQESEARHRAYASDMNIASQALDDNNLGHALELLDQQRPGPGQTDLRGWEWRYLWARTRSDALLTLRQNSNEIRSLSASPDGNLVAVTVHGRGGLSLWSVPERREIIQLAQTEKEVCAVLSPAEPLLAFSGIGPDPSGRERSSLRLWNFANRQMIAERALDGECAHLAIAQDGRTLVTVTIGETYGSGGHIAFWRLPEGTEQRRYPLSGSPTAFAVTPDVSLAAMGGRDGIRVIDPRDGRVVWAAERTAKALAFSPDGKRLAGGGDGDDVLIWDAATGQELGRLKGHQSWVTSLAFWPDGKKLASGGADQTIRIWDVPNRQCVDLLRGHRQQVWQLALIPGRQTLVSGGRDGAVCLWDTSIDRPRPPRIEIPDSALAWAFEAGSKSVVTLNYGGRVTRWKGAAFDVREPLLETGAITDRRGFRWCFSSDGHQLALGSAAGVVQVWDIPRRALSRQLTNSTGQVRAVRFFANGSRLLTFSVKDRVVHDWDLTSGAEIQSWHAPADIIHFALSPDERQFVTMGYDGDVLLTDMIARTTAKLHLDIRKSHEGNFSPDQRLLAVPSSLGFVRIWDPATWAEVKTLRGFFDQVFGAVFFPDGSRLAAASAGREAIRLYDTSTWQDTLTLEGQGDILFPTMVSQDGNVIGASTIGGERLQLWRAPSWDEIQDAEANEKPARKPPGEGLE